ncbi:hypothetical protein J6590_021372 [Homalodisca vitripennis]|nr:hypothetical protein J6590_021372 [Homalodisca vitripennis]
MDVDELITQVFIRGAIWDKRLKLHGNRVQKSKERAKRRKLHTVERFKRLRRQFVSVLYDIEVTLLHTVSCVSRVLVAAHLNSIADTNSRLSLMLLIRKVASYPHRIRNHLLNESWFHVLRQDNARCSRSFQTCVCRVHFDDYSNRPTISQQFQVSATREVVHQILHGHFLAPERVLIDCDDACIHHLRLKNRKDSIIPSSNTTDDVQRETLGDRITATIIPSVIQWPQSPPSLPLLSVHPLIDRVLVRHSEAWRQDHCHRHTSPPSLPLLSVHPLIDRVLVRHSEAWRQDHCHRHTSPPSLPLLSVHPLIDRVLVRHSEAWRQDHCHHHTSPPSLPLLSVHPLIDRVLVRHSEAWRQDHCHHHTSPPSLPLLSVHPLIHHVLVRHSEAWRQDHCHHHTVSDTVAAVTTITTTPISLSADSVFGRPCAIPHSPRVSAR